MRHEWFNYEVPQLSFGLSDLKVKKNKNYRNEKNDAHMCQITWPAFEHKTIGKKKNVETLIHWMPLEWRLINWIQFSNRLSSYWIIDARHIIYVMKCEIYMQFRTLIRSYNKCKIKKKHTSCSFPIRCETHCWTPSMSVLTLISPSFPLLLISWSGLTTSFWKVLGKNMVLVNIKV